MVEYEIVFLLKNTKPEIITQLTNKIDDILKVDGGEIIMSNHWGIINLAYPIKKETNADFFIRIVKTDPKNILVLKKLPKIERNVLRTLVINTQKEKKYVRSINLSNTQITPEEFQYQVKSGTKKNILKTI